jgi:hypothetical protein
MLYYGALGGEIAALLLFIASLLYELHLINITLVRLLLNRELARYGEAAEGTVTKVCPRFRSRYYATAVKVYYAFKGPDGIERKGGLITERHEPHKDMKVDVLYSRARPWINTLYEYCGYLAVDKQ